MGLLLFGGGDMTPAVRAARSASATACCGCSAPLPTWPLCFASLGAVGLFVSTLTEQPIGATIAVVIFSTASFILDTHPAGRAGCTRT